MEEDRNLVELESETQWTVGRPFARLAVAHKILVVIWHLLKTGTEHREKFVPTPEA